MAPAPVDDAEREATADAAGPLVALEAADGVIIYDRQDHRAWLQSDGAVSVAERR